VKFATISLTPTLTIEIADYPDLQEAEKAIGLDPGAVDHGFIQQDLAIVVYEWSLFAEPRYYAFGQQLYNGPAVLYAFGEAGETRDITASDIPSPRWLGSVGAAEAAIAIREVIRPVTRVNGEPVWVWTGKVEKQ
jgi:hypothetical protein